MLYTYYFSEGFVYSCRHAVSGRPVTVEAQCIIDRDNSDPNQRVEGEIRLRQKVRTHSTEYYL